MFHKPILTLCVMCFEIFNSILFHFCNTGLHQPEWVPDPLMGHNSQSEEPCLERVVTRPLGTKHLDQGHTISPWQSWNQNPDLLGPTLHSSHLPRVLSGSPPLLRPPSPRAALARSSNLHTPLHPLCQDSPQLHDWLIKAKFFLLEFQPHQPRPEKSWSAQTSYVSPRWMLGIDDSPTKALYRLKSLGMDVSFTIDCLNASLF